MRYNVNVKEKVFVEGAVMAIIVEKKNAQYFENRKRRYKKIVASVIIFMLIIAISIALFIIYQLNNITYSSYITAASLERQDGVYTKYASFNDGVVRYSKDGAMYIDTSGNSIWNSTYDMNNPISDGNLDYFIISDVGYNKIELFNRSGHVKSLEVLYPIIKAEVANQGVVSVLMDGGDVNYIKLFSQTGQTLIDSRTTIEKNGFAVDFSMSDDGEKLVTSYISISNGLMQSKITFYNFGMVGQNYEDKIVAGFDYGQTLVSKVEFLNNDTVCIFGDDKLSIYSMEEIPKLIHEETFQTEVKSIAYSDEYIGIIQKNPEGDERYLLSVYNKEGHRVLGEEVSYYYEDFKISKNELIFRSSTEVNILRLNGKEKFNYSFDRNIDEVFSTPLKDEYLIFDQININRIKLVK
ncbi:MAG: hypothetical protein GX323_05355 [Clostridiales bacterium]|nr:hypothetical protein [Clostridiales bacterium]